jgi:sugar phosphate isomerase/epimerase
LNRREFVLSVGAATVYPSMPRSRQRPLGVQLYTVRSALERDFEGTLARIAGIGVAEVELAGTFGRSAAQVRGALAASGLTPIAAHVDHSVLDGAADRILDEVAAIGCRAVVVPWLPAEMRATLEDVRRVAAMFDGTAERARRAGLAFAYHNQAYDGQPLDGRVPLEVLLAASDPGLVGLELDVFWAAQAGIDPVAIIEQHPGRVRMIHAKDMAADGAMVDVGRGTLDFARIISAGDVNGLEHIFVEHDEPADAFESIRAGLSHLRRILG